MVFQKLSKGFSIDQASKDIDKQLNGATAGCGPAHRIAPLASLNNIQKNQLIDFAKEEAKITHYHPDAGNCSAIMVLLCKYLLEGKSWIESKKTVSETEQLKSTWLNIQNANLNSGGYVLDVMHSALYFLDKENSLENSLLFAGSANYCPIIVGILENIRKEIIKK